MSNNEFYPVLNEVYNTEWMYLNVDDSVSVFNKKEFRRLVKQIAGELYEEGFTENEIEEYLKTTVEQVV